MSPRPEPQCSYNHFTEVRNIMWPNGIEKLFDFYSTASLEVFFKISEENISIFCTGLRKDILESGEHPRQSTKAISQSAEPQNCESSENVVPKLAVRGFAQTIAPSYYFFPFSQLASKSAGLENEEVREETGIYMVLSSLRLAAFLNKHSVSREKYNMFLQATIQNSAMHLNTTDLRPSMHYLFHVDDFTFGFNSEELKEYNQVIHDCRHCCQERRERLRGLCNKYIERQTTSSSTFGRILGPLRRFLSLSLRRKFR